MSINAEVAAEENAVDQKAVQVERVLKAFCAKDEDGRAYLHEPFQFGELSCASNGSAIVYSHLVLENLPDADKSITGTLGQWEEKKAEQYTPFPALTIPDRKLVNCEECEGKGSVEFENEFNCYDCCCKTCDGAGQFEKAQLTDVPGFKSRFDAKLIKLVSNIESVEIGNVEDYLVFRFEHGFGVVASAHGSSESENDAT